MPQLADLKPSITELSDVDALALIKEIQASRLRTKVKPKKAKAVTGKMHGLMEKDGRTYRTWCKKERDCNAKSPRITEDLEMVTCKGCLKAKKKAYEHTFDPVDWKKNGRKYVDTMIEQYKEKGEESDE